MKRKDNIQSYTRTHDNYSTIYFCKTSILFEREHYVKFIKGGQWYFGQTLGFC